MSKVALVKSDYKGGYFNGYIRSRIKNNQNFICAITGGTGSGKSYSALRQCEILDPNFDARNVCFAGSQFMDIINGKVKETYRGMVILFDELQVTLGHLDYQSIQAKLLNYTLQTFRHKNFILFVTTPQFSFINASARKLFHCRMETVKIDRGKKQVVLKPFLLQVNQKEGKVYEKYLRVYNKKFGVMPLKSLKVGMPSKALLEAYEQKKTEFTTKLNETIAKDLRKVEGTERKTLTPQQEKIVKLLVDGLTIPKIADNMNRSVELIYKQIALIENKGISITPKKEQTRIIGYEVSGYD